MNQRAAVIELRRPLVGGLLLCGQIPGVLPGERQLHRAASEHHAADQTKWDRAAQSVKRERGHAVDDEKAAADCGESAERYRAEIEAIADEAPAHDDARDG